MVGVESYTVWFVSNGETIREYRSLEEANQYVAELIAGLKPREPKVDYVNVIFYGSYATAEEAENKRYLGMNGVFKRTVNGNTVTLEAVKSYE